MFDGASVALLVVEQLVGAPLVQLDVVAQVALAARDIVAVVRHVACASLHAALALAQVALARLELRLRKRLLGLLSLGLVALFVLLKWAF